MATIPPLCRVNPRATLATGAARALGVMRAISAVAAIAAAGAWVAETSAQQAVDPPSKEAGFGKAKAGGKLLSRAELRECMALQERMRAQGAETLRLQAELEKEKTEVTQLGAALKEQLAVLDRGNAEAVEAYNRQAQEFDRRADLYNAATPGFNARVDALSSDRQAFTRGCENRRFDELDEIAIKKGK